MIFNVLIGMNEMKSTRFFIFYHFYYAIELMKGMTMKIHKKSL